MATNVRDYAKLAKDIMDTLGEKNISNATHCATRLRLTLKESPSGEVTKTIEGMPGVIQVVEKGGQYQIVIGTHAKDVYGELANLMQLDENAADEPEVKQSLLNRVIATMSGVFAPFVYVLAAAGLLQGCLIIVNQFSDTFSSTGFYEVMNFISWTPFTFLPVFIAMAAAKHFKCNMYVSVACCLALVSTFWSDMAARIAEGETIRFLMFPMSQTTYTSTVLPPLFLVLILSYLERFLDKRLPDAIKALATPFLCLVIMVPLTLLVVGPITEFVADQIAVGYNFLYGVAPALAALIIGGLWQIIVVFGVHWGIVPIILADFAANGCDSIQVFVTCAILAQIGATFAVFFKSKNKDFKGVALSSGITGLFGITEPAIYGVTLRLKKPLLCGCVASAIGSMTATFFGAQYQVYAGLPGPLTMVNAINPDQPSSFLGMVIGGLLAFAGAFLLTFVVGFDDPEGPKTEAKPKKAASEKKETTAVSAVSAGEEGVICAPLNGEVKELSQVNDATFAAGILGQGAAIIPSEGKLYAPFDGKVSSIFDTKHAIGLENDMGAEMLIHIGLETVTLGGKGFHACVEAGDRVKAGDVLIEFDLKMIGEKFDTITPILVSNTDEFERVEILKISGEIKAGTPIIKVKK